MSSKVCVVVGVGAGLGLSIASRFGREGYQIAMIARRQEVLDSYAEQLAQLGIQASGFSADVANEKSLIQAFEAIQSAIAPPDVLVYNAAVMKEFNPLTLPSDELVQDFKVAVVGALTSIQQVVSGFKSQGGGTILLTGGALALDQFSPPQYLSLAIGKAGIRKLSFTMANALEPENIHVATVTVCGTIAPNTDFDPDRIAQVYWDLHSQSKENWQREYVYR